MTAILYRGHSDVALWTGVGRAAVSNWMRRFPDQVPEPDAEVHNADSKAPVRGYLPERRPEWEAFAAERQKHPAAASLSPARAAARNIRRTADAITRQAEAGEITERAAIELLAALIGTTPVTPTEENPS